MKSKLFTKQVLILMLLSLLISGVNAQNSDIKGRVTDNNGEPLPGVTILIKGTTSGTITDKDGHFTLKADKGNTLVFSFIGFLVEEVVIEDQTTVDLTLIPDIIGIDDVVVIGYGTQAKSDIISSVVTIKPESMIKVPTADVGEMLRGKATGVYITLGDAGPGGSSNILIRGKNTISIPNSNPIIIADGVPVENINDINPNDIASLEVLKDAASQAIYGARASNGVILITTKRAAEGKAKVNYSGYYGMQTVKRNFKVYSGEEFAQLKREAYRTDNNNTYLADEDIFTEIEQEVLAGGEFIDWEKEVLQLAPIQNHNLSLSTGTSSTKIFSSLNYLDQEGVVPGTNYKKFSIRLNIDQKVTEWMSFGANTSWQLSKNDDPGTGGTLQRTITTSPLGKIYNDDGTYRLYPTGVQESFNPLLDINETTNLLEDRNDIMNLFVDIMPIKGFKYRLNASRRSWNRKGSSYSSSESLWGVQSGEKGQGSMQFGDNVEWQLENIFTYEAHLQKHNLGITFVQSASEKKVSSFRNESTDFPNDLLGIYGLEAAARNTPIIEAYRRGLVSFVGRIQYDYDSKYYLTASARADGSTVFGANNKWGYFPSVALGWNIYRESFAENIELISNLKLRGSYGSVGNEGINPYESQSTAIQRDYIFDGSKTLGYVPGSFLPNPNLKWETSTILNVAIDYGLWRNRLSGTLEVYNTRTKDLLVNQALNAASGYSRMRTNLGEIENKGFELNMNGVIVSKRELSINAGFSVSQNKNKIISLYGKDEDEDGIEDDDLANRWFIGQPIDVYYQYKPVGIFQEGEDIIHSHQPESKPGDIKLYDRYPDDGILNADDNVLTKRDPDWFGSFNFEINYKNIDFAFDVLTVQGVIKNNPYLYGYSQGGSLRGVLNGVKQDYWLPENPSGNWPRPTNANDPRYIWTMGLQDASFIRLQNITFGYTLPENLLSKIKTENLRIYCTGHNLYTYTRFQSYSPEKEPNEYPEAISIVIGIQAAF
ncbi:MAG: TonB-dependent receptor [Bacteroidales bacterium]|nr:TonB-dependent receptor [Bacteroidales bacterium]